MTRAYTRSPGGGDEPDAGDDMTHRPCRLREAVGIEGASCDEAGCTYWRVAGHLGVSEEQAGCAIQYFGLLGEHGREIARWLLSVKERVEGRG